MRYIFAVLMMFCGAAALADDAPALQDVAGVYKDRFANGDVDGTKYKSENILELVPVDQNGMYVRAHLEFYNGHSCDIAVVARRYDRDMTYYGADGCALSLAVSAQGVTLHDADNACKARYCGVRGSFEGIGFAADKKRDIHYMPIVLKSDEYHRAVDEDAALQSIVSKGTPPQYAYAKDLLAHYVAVNDSKGVEMSLSAGADINTYSEKDTADLLPPLLIAIREINLAMVKFLIEHGADVKIGDEPFAAQPPGGRPVIFDAVEKASDAFSAKDADAADALAIVKLMLAHGAATKAEMPGLYDIAAKYNDTELMALFKL